MSKPMKKGVKVLLILLIVLVLLAACFLSVALYARMEFKKERSWLPPEFTPQQASVTELPDNAHDAYVYAMRLYNEAVASDITEGSWRTEVDLGGDAEVPFADADRTVFDDIRAEATGAVQAMYPTVSGAKMSDESADDIPVIDLKEEDILEYVYDPAEIFNRKGEYIKDSYELVFKVAPAYENTDDVIGGDVYNGICDAVKDALTVNSADIDVREVEIRFTVDRLSDHLTNVVVTRGLDVRANVTFTDAYGALLKDAGNDPVDVTLPYRATEHIDFMWYGLRFTEDYLEQKPADIIPLPIEVHVNGAAVQGKDFELEYDISAPETMKIDDDNVLTVERVSETSDTEGVTVTATLTYEGKTYTDDILIYVTELDKTTTGVRFWKDGFSVAVGETALLPAEIRIPVNEQSEQRSEEEYEMDITVSDPDALTVEADDKDLYCTALKAADAPVTVSVEIRCGGHTYNAELPVTITEGTEVTDNG